MRELTPMVTLLMLFEIIDVIEVAHLFTLKRITTRFRRFERDPLLIVNITWPAVCSDIGSGAARFRGVRQARISACGIFSPVFVDNLHGIIVKRLLDACWTDV